MKLTTNRRSNHGNRTNIETFSAQWSEVTGALDDFVEERRSLVQRAIKKGRELAYFSTAVRTDLDIAPIVAGISVFEC